MGWGCQGLQCLTGLVGVLAAVMVVSLGYQSEPAFSRAFKRVFNVSPGSIRLKQ
jgi:hypothetical protein